MKRAYHISSPCPMKWEELLPKHNGRFCRSCERTVVDLHGKSDAEVASLFIKNGGKLCGRIPAERPAPAPAVKRKLVVFLQACLLVFGSFLFTGVVSAQVDVSNIVEVQENYGTLSLTVQDEAGEALMFGNVFVFNDNLETGAATDINGRAEIKNLPYGTYNVRISYIGYTTIEIDEVVIDRSAVILPIVQAEIGSNVLEGIVVTETPTENSEPSWVGMIWMGEEIFHESPPPDTVAVELSSFEAKVYPNPFTNRVAVSAPEIDGAEIWLFDMTGKNLLQIQLYQQPQSLDLHRLVAGTYILQVRKGEEVLFSEKIVKHYP